jgi:alpha-beta hydrolase superfamily lysophospholipase
VPARSVDLHIDVTDAAGLGEPAHLAVTVTAPDVPPPAPVVCFAKPGAGYGRRYYTEDLPGPGSGSQAAWHAARGWIFVSVDHLGVGDSSLHDPEWLSFTPLIAAAHAAEREVLDWLAAGSLVDGLPPVADALTIGIGQSMGGAFTVVQQGRHHCYDGVGVLGYSPLRTQPPTAPGTPPLPLPWVPRDTQLSDAVVTNGPALAGAPPGGAPSAEALPMAWGFHYDDVDPAVVRRDMQDYPARGGELPPWGSATIPATAVLWSLAPGSTLAEAAAIRCPVLVALGERDVLVDPRGEPRAYESARSVDLFVCPRMAHMHNFAGTRELFWRRIETWAEWVRATRDRPSAAPG